MNYNELYDPPPSYEEAMRNDPKRKIINSPIPTAPPLDELDNNVSITTTFSFTNNRSGHYSSRISPQPPRSTPESTRSSPQSARSSPESARSSPQPQISSSNPSRSYQLSEQESQSNINYNFDDDLYRLKHAINIKNPDVVIEILCKRTQEYRNRIIAAYNRTESEYLDEKLLSQFKNEPEFASLMLGMIVPLNEFIAWTVYRSRSFKWMCLILTVLSSDVLKSMTTWFFYEFGINMTKYIEDQVKSDHDHPDKKHLKHILRVTNTIRKPDSSFSRPHVLADIENLLFSRFYPYCKDQAKTMFYGQSFKHIKGVAGEYFKKTNESILDNIKAQYHCNGYILKAIVLYAINPCDYYAHVIEQSTKFLDCLDSILLTTVVLSNQNYSWRNIKKSFIKLTSGKKNLSNFIRSSTSGPYRDALCAIMGLE